MFIVFVYLWRSTRTVKHWKWCPWHRKASAKTQVSLTRFLQSEVKIIYIIVQNNTYYSARSRWTKQQQYMMKKYKVKKLQAFSKHCGFHQHVRYNDFNVFYRYMPQLSSFVLTLIQFPYIFPSFPNINFWAMEVQCQIPKGSPIIPILSRISTIPHIDTYFSKSDSNIKFMNFKNIFDLSEMLHRIWSETQI